MLPGIEKTDKIEVPEQKLQRQQTFLRNITTAL